MHRIREYFYGLMVDRRGGLIASLLKCALWICSLAYGVIVRFLSGGYDKKFFIAYRPDPKVISIGNITVGGTGKTQAAIDMTRVLEARGKKVSVLIRGYGTDEYMMLQEELKDCPILVGPDRIENSKRAFYNFGIDTIILDDGFQHWKIAKDLNIVLVDATNPFGNYHLIPRGILREPISALRRADLIIITKVDSSPSKRGEIYGVVDALGKKDCVLESIYKPLGFSELSGGKRKELEFVREKRVCLVSSIGNPYYFKEKVKQLGAAIELEFVFLDHYQYMKEDLYKIDGECRFLDIEFIIATKKDAVKIKRFCLATQMATPILVLDVNLEITKNKQILDERLSGIYNS